MAQSDAAVLNALKLGRSGPAASQIDSDGRTQAHACAPVGLAEGVTRSFLLHHRICPIGIGGDGALRVAVEPDSRLEGLDDLSVAYGVPVVPEAMSAASVQVLIERLTSAGEQDIDVSRGEGEGDAFASDIRDLANQPPVVRYLNLLLRDAYEAGASDIHLESTRQGLEARFRIDGVLGPAQAPAPALSRAVISRVKLLADLDIAERRRPQDGRFRVRLEDRELDLRVSTVPTIFGESVVLRLLERGGRPIALVDLGLPPDVLHDLRRLARKPHGMILATGPTGAGKTTTLYALLGLRDAKKEKIITLEDPIEYALEGVTQVPIHEPAGVTFASMLRSILRQDPDVIMVGEMRDGVTAELAVQAALTGHVVFSTLHTNDAVGAIARLIDLGVPPFLVAATLDGVLAQRLVRRTCDACREPYTPDPEVLRLIGETEMLQFAPATSRSFRPSSNGRRVVDSATAVAPTFTRGRGCAACRGTGYRGRIGIFELLVVDEEFREAIIAGARTSKLRDLAARAGMRLLRADGLAKVQAGLTTVEEVLRVTAE